MDVDIRNEVGISKEDIRNYVVDSTIWMEVDFYLVHNVNFKGNNVQEKDLVLT